MTLIKPQKDPAIGHGKCDHRKVERVAGRHFGTSVMSDNKFKTAADTMEVMMAMLDWNDYRNQILARVGEIGKLSPDTVKGYMALGGAGAKTGHLDGKVRELIALAVAIALRCDGCIAVHTAAAKKHGATKEEIAEALGVGISVNAGAAMVYSTRTLDAFDATV